MHKGNKKKPSSSSLSSFEKKDRDEKLTQPTGHTSFTGNSHPKETNRRLNHQNLSKTDAPGGYMTKKFQQRLPCTHVQPAEPLKPLEGNPENRIESCNVICMQP